MNKPNFFLVGFPKCGTTSLARYLSEHNDILFSKHKEPHYFAFDYTYPVVRQVTSEADYLQQFADGREDYLAIGEGSTGYIFSTEAIDRIVEFVEKPLFILVVRNPVELAVSAHAEMLKSGHEDIEDFGEAWRLSPQRAQGQCLPKHRTEAYHVCYQDIGRVGSRLEWLMERVERDQLKVVVFDDMAADIQGVYVELLKFLGVADDGRTTFGLHNERRYHRFKLVANLVNRPPRSWVAAVQRVKDLLGMERLGFINRLRNWNLTSGARPLDPELAREMQEHYRGEVELLEKLLGRQFDWLPAKESE